MQRHVILDLLNNTVIRRTQPHFKKPQYARHRWIVIFGTNVVNAIIVLKTYAAQRLVEWETK